MKTLQTCFLIVLRIPLTRVQGENYKNSGPVALDCLTQEDCLRHGTRGEFLFLRTTSDKWQWKIHGGNVTFLENSLVCIFFCQY